MKAGGGVLCCVGVSAWKKSESRMAPPTSGTDLDDVPKGAGGYARGCGARTHPSRQPRTNPPFVNPPARSSKAVWAFSKLSITCDRGQGCNQDYQAAWTL
jgi:hypothetical protein